MEDIGLFETIDSLPQITRDKPDPVPSVAFDTIIDAATQAPNGGNSSPASSSSSPTANHSGNRG